MKTHSARPAALKYIWWEGVAEHQPPELRQLEKRLKGMERETLINTSTLLTHFSLMHSTAFFCSLLIVPRPQGTKKWAAWVAEQHSHTSQIPCAPPKDLISPFPGYKTGLGRSIGKSTQEQVTQRREPNCSYFTSFQGWGANGSAFICWCKMVTRSKCAQFHLLLSLPV